MITVEKAQEIIGKFNKELKTESVNLFASLDRILAEDIETKVEMPPFNKSAMDGYAVDKADLSIQYRVVGTIPAGFVSDIRINRGECAKIMTGAMLPEGTNRVVKKEITSEKNGLMQIVDTDSNNNVCYRGEDVKAGDIVVKKGVKINPGHIGIMASAGCGQIKVFKKPVIGIVTTGSEIVEPGKMLNPGQIFNSNSYSIGAQYLNYGCLIEYDGTVVDKREDIKKSIESMLEIADIVVISGGVSMGDFDFVPEVLKEIGVDIKFGKIAVKPGKPTVYGLMEEKVVFGLPGNPVSTFVINEVFVKPLIFKLLGYSEHEEVHKCVIDWHFTRKKGARTSYIPVKLTGDTVQKINYHGSAHIQALAQANSLLEIPKNVLEIEKGEQVNVRLI